MNKLDNIPIMLSPLHLLPGMKAILTINSRAGMDLIHHISRGNRKFVIMATEESMRGFVLEMKRMIPTMVRGVAMIEVEGIDRF